MYRALAILMLTTTCTLAASTNKPPSAAKEKERKAEHTANKIVVKSRAKGSNDAWQTEREYPLMFSNNRKLKLKQKKEGKQQ